MGYTYTPTYYSSFQDSVTSLCKNILPFSFKKRKLLASERKQSKQQSDNLKWQQESFHNILNLMGLHREGILPESEVSAFKSRLLEKLIGSKAQNEHPAVLRDRLLFLQELLFAKCITTEEYHASKRPLIHRLEAQGAEIEARDVIASTSRENSDEEWSVIDLRDEISKDGNSNSESRFKPSSSAMKKHIKEAASVLGFGGPSKNRTEKSIFDHLASNDLNNVKDEDHCQFGVNNIRHGDKRDRETKSILISETLANKSDNSGKENDAASGKGFLGLFHNKLEEGGEKRSATKKQWGFDGFKKWKKGNNAQEDETAPPLPLLSLWKKVDNSNANIIIMNSSDVSLVSNPIGEGPDTKQIKSKLHSDGSVSDFFTNKVLGDKIKQELSRIKTELSSTNPNIQLSNDQIEAISTKLPVDKTDLKKFFPKSWCDRYGDVVLDVVKKEFKEHMVEIESMRNIYKDKKSSTRWTKFDDDENSHPKNLFAARQSQESMRNIYEDKKSSTQWTTFDDDENSHPNNLFAARQSQEGQGGFMNSSRNNPFFVDHNDRSTSLSQEYNPFWDGGRGGTSVLGQVQNWGADI